MRLWIERAIISLFEPYIQAMITNRIVAFHEGLVRDGAIDRVQPSGPTGADTFHADILRTENHIMRGLVQDLIRQWPKK